MNRIQKAFLHRPICIPFLTAGYPNEDLFVEIVLLLAKKGCGLIEIGFPFSDPVADGPVIQKASQKVLDQGMTLDKSFALIQKIRKYTSVPLVIMTYYNIVLSQNPSSFVQKCSDYGVDGLIVPDLLMEEASFLRKVCQDRVALTFFLSMLTDAQRRKKIIQKTTGFLYCLSRLGVTGGGSLDIKGLKKWIQSLQSETKKPLALGFGLSELADVRALSRFADGLIIGSALLSHIEEGLKVGSEHCLKKVSDFISPVIEVLKERQ